MSSILPFLSHLTIPEEAAVGNPEPTPDVGATPRVDKALTLHVALPADAGREMSGLRGGFVVPGAQPWSGAAADSPIWCSFVRGERGSSCYLFTLLKKRKPCTAWTTKRGDPHHRWLEH